MVTQFWGIRIARGANGHVGGHSLTPDRATPLSSRVPFSI